jgi:WD40 repeat protein
VVTSSEDNTTCLWNATDGEQLQPFLGSNGTANWAAFSPDGQWVVIASNDHLARVWDLAGTIEGRGEGAKSGSPRPSSLVARPSPGRWLSADGRLVIEAKGGRAQISVVATGEPGRPKPVGKTLEHASQVLHASFSPDNGRVATASDDNAVRIWDTLTGELLILLMHDSSVYFVSFSSTGRFVLTATKRNARVWEAMTGEPITPPRSLEAPIGRVSFAPDDTEVVLSSMGQKTWTWSLRGDNRPTADLMRLARVLAGKRVDTSRGLLPLGPESLSQTWEILRREYPADLGPP